MFRRDLVSGPEMHLGQASQRLPAFLLRNLAGGFFDRRGNASSQLHSEALALPLQPINEGFARQNRCSGDRKI